MDVKGGKSPHLSEKANVKCRVCKTELRRKNYKAHLKAVHPKENAGDLSGLSQNKLTSMLLRVGNNRKVVRPTSEEEEQPGGGSVSDDVRKNSVDLEEEIDDAEKVADWDDIAAEHGESVKRKSSWGEEENEQLRSLEEYGHLDKPAKKKRIESGDSAFSEPVNETVEPIDLSDSKLDLTLGKLQQQQNQFEKFETDLEDLKKIVKPHSNISTKVHIEDDDAVSENKDALMLLLSARSMVEVEGIGFEYDDEDCKLKCVLCDQSTRENTDNVNATSGEFKYSPVDGLVFHSKEKMSRNFINLKSHVKAHILKNKSHCLKLDEKYKKEAAKSEVYSKNRKAGLNLGRAAVKNYIHGRPYTDFVNDVLLMKKSGGIVGELNHSQMFPARFRNSVCRVVNGRVKRFIKTPLEITGHLPPVALSADKGTYKGTPRQFCAIVTVNPGGENFLEVMTAGQPVVKDGSSGRQLALNMKSAFDYIGVSASQIKSGVFDGVYDHVNIEKHLCDLYPEMKDEDFLFTWDPLHRTGIADKNVSKDEVHKWIQKLNRTSQQIYGLFSWGASHVKLREAAVKLGIHPRNLVNFSATRFANSKRRVYQVIFEMFPAIMDCLNHYIQLGEDNRSGLEAANRDIRDKADTAKELKGKIMNAEFLLTLGGLCDLYEQFGRVVQVRKNCLVFFFFFNL